MLIKLLQRPARAERIRVSRDKYGGQRPTRAEKIEARRAETTPSGGRVLTASNNTKNNTKVVWYVVCVAVGGPAWCLVVDTRTARVRRFCPEDRDASSPAVINDLYRVMETHSPATVPMSPGKSWIFSWKFYDLESPGKISLKVVHFSSGSNGKQAAVV